MATKRKKTTAGIPGSEQGYSMSEEKEISVPRPELESALKGIGAKDEEMVQLINLTMGNATLWVPKGVGVARASVKPFSLRRRCLSPTPTVSSSDQSVQGSIHRGTCGSPCPRRSRLMLLLKRLSTRILVKLFIHPPIFRMRHIEPHLATGFTTL